MIQHVEKGMKSAKAVREQDPRSSTQPDLQDKDEAGSRPESPRHGIAFGSALALSTSIFLLIPSVFFQSQADSVPLAFGNFYLIGALSAIVVAVFLYVLALLLRPFLNISKFYLVLGIAITIKAFFLASQVPVLDGDAEFTLLWTTPGLWSIASILISLACGIGAVYFFHLNSGLALVVIAALSLQPLLDGRNWAFEKDALSSASIGRPTQLLTFSKNHENVLVVLIDTFSSDVFAQIVEEDKGLRDELRGFTYFPNTIAYAPYTLISMITVYSGHRYAGGSLKSLYGTARTDSIFSDAESDGGVTTLGGFYFFRECPAQHCWTESKILGTRPIEGSLLEYVGLLEDGILRLAPTAAHAWIYNGGKGHLRGYFDISSLTRGRLSEKVIQDFAANLTAVDGPPTLKFLHLMTTHSPLVLNSDCGLVSPMSHRRENYKQQATCATRGFANLLVALKGAGLYDNTTIVFMSDHGASVDGHVPKRRFFDVVDPVIGRVGRFKPVFAIKPTHSREPFGLSTVPAQLSDLRKTLCAIAFECQPDVPGEDIFALSPNSDRARSFVDYDNPSFVRHLQQSESIPGDFFVRFSIGGTLQSLHENYDPQKYREGSASSPDAH